MSITVLAGKVRELSSEKRGREILGTGAIFSDRDAEFRREPGPSHVHLARHGRFSDRPFAQFISRPRCGAGGCQGGGWGVQWKQRGFYRNIPQWGSCAEQQCRWNKPITVIRWDV